MSLDTDDGLIGYCEIHCETPRALFKGTHINRMLALAGRPKNFVQSVPDDGWYSMHEDMALLCRLARERIANPPTSQVIPFKPREKT